MGPQQGLTKEDAEKRRASNDKHSSKVSRRRGQALEIQSQVRNYLAQCGMRLPISYTAYKEIRHELFAVEAGGEAVDESTGEVVNLEAEFGELVRYVYAIGNAGKSIYALFSQGQGQKRTQILCTQYSRKRVDPVWEYRLRMLIVKNYFHWLKDTGAHKTYQAVHMVLTVPHANGVYVVRNAKGKVLCEKRHYARELINAFTAMRKTVTFRKYVWGGEYGVEIKRGRDGNGLHIHVHSLVFQYRQFSINEARAAIGAEWEKFSGGKVFWYESLYLKEKTHKQVVFNPETNEHQRVEVWEKKYVNPDSTELEVLQGVLETVKYHFKTDELMQHGVADVELLKELLNGAKGIRLFSRYGALYSDERLCFNKMKKDTEAVEQAERMLEKAKRSQTHLKAAKKLAEAESGQRLLIGVLAATEKGMRESLQAAIARDDAGQVEYLRGMITKQVAAATGRIKESIAYVAGLANKAKVAKQKHHDKVSVLTQRSARLSEAVLEAERRLEDTGENEPMATTDGVLESLVNPNTLTHALPGTYEVIVTQPEFLKHLGKDTALPNKPLFANLPYWRVTADTPLKAIMQHTCKGELKGLLVPEDRALFEAHEAMRMGKTMQTKIETTTLSTAE